MATNVMDVLDPNGHLSLSWDPDKPEEVQRAREEFERLKSCGFMFYTVSDTGERKEGRFAKARGKYEVRATAEQTKEFDASKPRTVAHPPRAGG